MRDQSPDAVDVYGWTSAQATQMPPPEQGQHAGTLLGIQAQGD